MIAKMMKYDILLLAGAYQDFIDRVRAIGLVDITTSSWQCSDSERDLILEIEAREKAIKSLKSFAESESYASDAVALGSANETYELYVDTKSRQGQTQSQITLFEKSLGEATVWGDFSLESIEALAAQGVLLRFFVAGDSVYADNAEQWGSSYTIEKINSLEGRTYFVVVTTAGEEITLDAQELHQPIATSEECLVKLKELNAELKSCDKALSQCVASLAMLESEWLSLLEKLQNSKVRNTAERAADGALLVMEGWAEESTCSAVDTLLDSDDNVLYIKRRPTPEDNTPVKLNNRFFARAFELVGNMYALPKYGTIDLTPFFAPFYMLFFAICLCDAGYGLMIGLAGLGLYLKGGQSMRQASYLSMMCGAAAFAFGIYANSFFGMQISSIPAFSGVKFLNFQQDFFSIAMIIGVIQLLFGMVINIIVTSRNFGVKYALGTIGWFSLIVVTILSFLSGSMGIEWFGFSSIPYLVLVAVSAVLMLCFNSPDKNIFSNIGSGLWDTYNNVTGLLGDVLSYIRLFAIGLSGGVLALVFNSLAMGMTGLDAGTEGLAWWSIAIKVIFATIILLFGHGINLFMSTISSAVHPMRLTFVEFFRSAGFEMTTREFEPLESKK